MNWFENKSALLSLVGSRFSLLEASCALPNKPVNTVLLCCLVLSERKKKEKQQQWNSRILVYFVCSPVRGRNRSKCSGSNNDNNNINNSNINNKKNSNEWVNGSQKVQPKCQTLPNCTSVDYSQKCILHSNTP